MADVFGTNNSETINASDGVTNGADRIFGAGGNDLIFGLDGNDEIKGGGGADTFSGGGGTDTVNYTDSSAGVFVDLLSGDGRKGTAEGDTFFSIENVIGSGHDDDLVGNDGVNALQGLDGADTLKGFGGNDTLRGDNGNDILNGGAGADTMMGNFGNDTYIVDDHDDVVSESAGQGIDTVLASVSYTLPAGADVETLATTNDNGTAPLDLVGNSSGNVIRGNNGDNYINGAGGNDQLIGLGGNDFYYVDSMSDIVVESAGQGFDAVVTSASYTLPAGADIESLVAGIQTSGPFELTGNASGNYIRGNSGNNVINGGDGNDELHGFGGQDSFLFNTPLNAALNMDTITDFGVDDTILLDDAIFSAFANGPLAAERFVIGAAAQDASDNIIYNDVTGALSYDSDGNGAGAAIQFAQLDAGLALTNLDFLVV
jgi:Ca2+-binding RTX toxin-like protein